MVDREFQCSFPIFFAGLILFAAGLGALWTANGDCKAMSVTDWIQAITTTIAAVGAIGVLIVWKNQQKLTAKAEMARELLPKIHKLGLSVAFARGNEKRDIDPISISTRIGPRARNEAETSGELARELNPMAELLGELYGEDARLALIELCDIATKVQIAAANLLEGSRVRPITFRQDARELDLVRIYRLGATIGEDLVEQRRNRTVNLLVEVLQRAINYR